MNVYTLPRTPGATEMSEWASFCHQREPFIVIDHSTLRLTGRWTSVERKRQFRVASFHGSRHGLARGPERFFSTLAKAEAYAAQLSTERETVK